MRLYYNVGYQRGLPDEKAIDGVVAHTASVDSARSTDDLTADEILFDPNVYLWGLNCEFAARTCAYISTYPWTPIKVPQLDEFDGKRRDWIRAGVLPVIERDWPPTVPDNLEEMVEECLRWQRDAGATSLIAPAPLISQIYDGMAQYKRWFEAAATVCNRFDKPVLMTVAFSEVVFPDLLEGLLDLLTVDEKLDGFYLAMETAHTSPYVASPALAEALLELSYHLGHRKERTVVVNFSDTFGLSCLAVGATGFVAGFGMKHRRFSLADYSDGGGGPYPRFFSMLTFCRYLASADMERIRDEDLLSEFLADSTIASDPLLAALSSGQKANDVLGWQTERNRTAAAKAHYVQRLRGVVDELSSVNDLQSRIRYMRQLLVGADTMNSLLRETFADAPLDEDGAHVRLWRHVLSRFAQRYLNQ